MQGDLLDAVFASRRDAGASFDAYVRYRDGGCRSRDLEAAFAHALPVIREVCTSRDRGLIGAAAWAIWRALRQRRFSNGGRAAYWAYLRLTSRGAMAHQRATSTFSFSIKTDRTVISKGATKNSAYVSASDMRFKP